MIIKRSAFGYDNLTHLEAVKKVLGNKIVQPSKFATAGSVKTNIVPLADKMKNILGPKLLLLN